METKTENEKRQRLLELAAKVASEQDKFVDLVKELNQLLDRDLGILFFVSADFPVMRLTLGI